MQSNALPHPVLLRFLFLVCAFAALLDGTAVAWDNESSELVPDATLLRYPDVGREKIVFLFANDLWIVDREGGLAAPLASPEGVESFPKFSPDDRTIAFCGNYDGNRDLYTIPVQGGIPFRVTHHPAAEFLCDWTKDGRLLFYQAGLGGLQRMDQLFSVPASGGLPERLPVPYGTTGAVSPDGTWLAYTPNTRDFATWKRYCGGMASDIWLFNLKTMESRKVTDWEGTDTSPMWHGDRLYYLSDRGPEHRLNLWVHDLEAGTHEQITRFEDFDVKWPSLGPGDQGQGEIVFQKGPGLFLLDLKTLKSREVKVRLPGAKPSLKSHCVDAAKFIQDWEVSPTGKRALVQARGDIWTLPAEKGAPRNLTRTSGAAERYPAWSPDGRYVAYFSDASGEYQLCITQSDGQGETRQLTKDLAGYFNSPIWSPDSKCILFYDSAGTLYLHTLESSETKAVDQDPWAFGGRDATWSSDSRWVAFSGTTMESRVPRVKIYDLQSGEVREVTQGAYADYDPVFDRTGDYLFFVSSRVFNPTESEIGDGFIYRDTQVLMALPLRPDVKYPWPELCDEEKWGEEKKEEEAGKDDGKDAAEEAGKEKGGEEAAAPEGEGAQAAAKEDGVSGTWEGTAITKEGPLDFTLTLELSASGTVTGKLSSQVYTGTLSGSYDKGTGLLTGTISMDQGFVVSVEFKFENGTLSGTGTTPDSTVTINARRVSGGAGGGAEGESAGKSAGIVAEAKEVKIDFDGIEARAFILPVTKGRFGSVAVNNKNQLVYGREDAGIKLFDLKDEKKEEKSVAAGGDRFIMAAKGGKLLLLAGGGASLLDASAGSAPKKVPTDGMQVWIDPREEWRQVFADTWRIFRDFFYVDNMHGVDWPAMRERYGKMLDHCFTREEVSYVIGEMISELNVGHAYYFGGDGEDPPKLGVGMLGVDFALKDGAYAFAKIYDGAAWDPQERSPLLEAGLNVKEGNYLLAVNGVPLNTGRDPWAAFVGRVGDTVVLTISEKPQRDETARDVVVKTLRSEEGLRAAAWVERNRAYVEEKSGGQIGYLYIPDTAWDGRNAFARQFVSQQSKKALIVDERWNSGGFDPYCIVERLARPVMNFWARRHGLDLPSPGGAHQGPKCMLINGEAGSGGDCLPWRFRAAGLGKLIGTRTWGGLVGLSGNPGLIDGGIPSVPTIGFFETNGTWGIEGHGVDPDIGVIDDPALMTQGGDPQLDAAIAQMLKEIETYPYVLPRRPAPPDRSGMGIREEDL